MAKAVRSGNSRAGNGGQDVVHCTSGFVTSPLANLASRKAAGFRVTTELSDMTPYNTPRAYARLLDAARKAGPVILAMWVTPIHPLEVG